MNLLSLIIIFLALLVCGSIAYIAWELTSERKQGKTDGDDGDTPSSPSSGTADDH